MTDTKNFDTQKTKYGIEETKDVFDLGFAIVHALKLSLADGINIKDIGNLLLIFPAVGPAIAGIGSVPSEIADLDATEAQELLTHAAGKLGLSLDDPSLERKVVACIKVVLAGGEAIAAFN